MGVVSACGEAAGLSAMSEADREGEEMSDRFPYGRCECNGSKCCGGQGPACFTARRGGKAMLLCSRCILRSDQDRCLFIMSESECELFMAFDALGTVGIILPALREKVVQ